MHTRSKLLPSQKIPSGIFLNGQNHFIDALVPHANFQSLSRQFLRQKVSINSDPLGIRYQIPAAHAVCGTGEIA
jgi:hypothetical protein